MKTTITEFIVFLVGLRHPKITWVCKQLDLYGIKHRIRTGFNGPQIEIERGRLELAQTIVAIEVGKLDFSNVLTFSADSSNKPVAPSMESMTITILDLPDDHQLFDSSWTVKDVYKVTHPIPMTDEERDALVAETQALTDKVLNAPLPTEVIEVTPEQLAEPAPIAVVTDPAVEPWDEVDPLADDPPLVEEVEAAINGDSVEHALAVADELGAELNEIANEDEQAEADDDDGGLWDDEEDDMADVSDPVEEHPELDWLKADDVLKFTDFQFPRVEGLIRMYDVESSNVSAIGLRVKPKDPVNCTFYTRFKGGDMVYRYGPVVVLKAHELLGEAVRKGLGRQDTSVGSLYHHLIKVESEEGRLKCQRLTAEDQWVEVLPKKDRVKATKART